MQQWIAVKEAVAAWTAVDHDALQILAAIPVHLGAALVLRRPLSRIVPWLAVLAVGVLNEAVSGFADGVFETAELAQSRDDLLLFMSVPTVILIVARFMPGLLTRPPADAGIVVRVSPHRQHHRVVDAEYEEIS